MTTESKEGRHAVGNTYLIYTEARLDGKWRCIDGYYMHKPYGKNEEKLTLFSTYENGSRSYFGSTYEKLREIGNQTKFSELSEEVQKEHPELKYEYNFAGEPDETEAYYITVPMSVFVGRVPKGCANHGVIHKDRIADYESGEIEELWQDDDVDFSKLTDLERQVYQYYEWDDYWSWEYNFKKLKNIVDATISKYLNNEWVFDDLETRLVVLCL